MEMQTTIQRIKGIVTSIRTDKTFNVRTVEGEKHRLSYEGYLPVKHGDAISALVDFSTMTEPLKILHRPYVCIRYEKDVVTQFLFTLRGGVSPKVAEDVSNNLEKLVTSINRPEISSVPDYVSFLSESWEKTESKSIIRLLSPLSQQQAIHFLTAWRDGVDVRMLYLLGMKKMEIAECDSPLKQLRDRIIKNPYSVPQLPMDKCPEIDIMTERVAGITDDYCGKFLRDVYNNSERKGWSCTYSKWLLKRYPEHLKVKSTLEETFGLEWFSIAGVKDTLVYIRENLTAESNLVKTIISLVVGPLINTNTVPNFDIPCIHGLDKECDDDLCIFYTLDPEQRKAVTMALTKNFSIITGAAGTGKTKSIRAIRKALKDSGTVSRSTSFTGKATSRIMKLSGDATVANMHRMIVSPGTYAGFKHIIIDEASMVPITLMHKFLSAFRQSYAITLIGDVEQLPPIGWGMMLKECINSKRVPLTTLRTNHRVAKRPGDAIMINSNNIANWRDDLMYTFVESSNFIVKNCGDSVIIDMLTIIHGSGVDQSHVTVLSPYNQHSKVNKSLKLINRASQLINNGRKELVYYNTEKREWTMGVAANTLLETVCWHLGDRVMMLINDRDTNVMNGEEGIITHVTVEKVTVKFEDVPGSEGSVPLKRVVEYKLVSPEESERHVSDQMGTVTSKADTKLTTVNLTLSYGITIHKSQGSEWPIVILYMPDKESSFLNRNLLYTAITRASERIYVLGSIPAASKCVSNGITYRCEHTSSRLAGALPELEMDNAKEDPLDGLENTYYSADEDDLYD